MGKFKQKIKSIKKKNSLFGEKTFNNLTGKRKAKKNQNNTTSRKSSKLQYSSSQKTNEYKKLCQNSILEDNTSIETNSSLNAGEECSSNSGKLPIIPYIDEIESIIKSIGAEQIFQIPKNETTNTSKIFHKSDTHDELKQIILNKYNEAFPSIKNNKINLVLDIDQTLVFSKKFEEINDKPSSKLFNTINENKFMDCHNIQITSGNQNMFINVQVRKGLANFFEELRPYCNFYFNSMASQLYIEEVIKLLNEKYNLRFDEINSKNKVIATPPQMKKALPPEITRDGNFLILDDNLCAWDIQYIPFIIPTRKFYGKFDEKQKEYYDKFYQYYLFTNKVYCFNEKNCVFYNKNQLPYYAEDSSCEVSQLYYVSEIVKKSYFLSKILNLSVRHALHFLQNNILKNCFIYYEGEEKDFIKEKVNLLGGEFVSDINKATHILNKKKDLNGPINKYYELCLKWLFDSFFNFKRCDEYLPEYIYM